ncbi:MAG: signal recognition particle-docking protein FtsY [Nitrososphaerota archaeon]|jgi:fused signal recognition particle receptor|nr:signal recognition particle-docking protein FtsY [Nitrososphaerota archaeon]
MFEKLKSGFKGLVTKVTMTELKTDNLNPILTDFKMTLAENDVAFPVADKICDELEKRLSGTSIKRLDDRKTLVEDNLKQILLKILETDNRINLIEKISEKRQKAEPYVIMFVGINGTGKTTTIAKVVQYLRENKYSTVLAGADTYRAGSIEQLEEHARRLSVRVIKHTYGADPAAVAFDTINHAKAHGINVVLIDTAGRMQTNQNLMNELVKVKRVVKPDLVIFTVDSLIGNDAVMQAEEFNSAIGIDATILTKVDADIKGGSSLSVTYVTQKPILFIGIGQTYKDLEPFDPEKFVKMILR